MHFPLNQTRILRGHMIHMIQCKVERFKAQLVIRGFNQQYATDYQDIFSLTIMIENSYDGCSTFQLNEIQTICSEGDDVQQA